MTERSDHALAVAYLFRERHGVRLNGTCIRCVPDTVWPCRFFLRAQSVVLALASGREADRAE